MREDHAPNSYYCDRHERNLVGDSCEDCASEGRPDPKFYVRPPVSNKAYAHHLLTTEFYLLDRACADLIKCYGFNIYFVGSAITKRDYRDVDLRCVLPDKEYDALFAQKLEEVESERHRVLTQIAISSWLQKQTGLPIDFQFMKLSEHQAETGPCMSIGLQTFVKRRVDG